MTEVLLPPDWQARLAECNTLWVGFSGGLDSTVLLHVLSQDPLLASKLQIVHVHHGLSMHADAWVIHCQRVCDAWQLPLHIHYVTCDALSNVEDSARQARYDVFYALLQPGDGLILAHHRDDQAETLLLQLCRGAGIDGLAGMPVSRPCFSGVLLRPLLAYTRRALEDYATQYELRWIEDDSNQDITFSRNYVRHQLMPLLQAQWPSVVSQLVQSAAHCQQAKENLESLAFIDCPLLHSCGARLPMASLQGLNQARLSNVLRMWFKQQGLYCPSTAMLHRIMTDVMAARPDATPIVQWGDISIRRYQAQLYLLRTPMMLRVLTTPWTDCPAPVLVSAEGAEPYYVYATPHQPGIVLPMSGRIEIRCRHGGELFYWRGQHKSLKHLFQYWQIPPWERDAIPLLYVDDVLVAVVGYAISDAYLKTTGQTYALASGVFGAINELQ